jgi:adenylate cyclase
VGAFADLNMETLRVLVVEDDPVYLKIISRIVRRLHAGLSVTGSDNPAEGYGMAVAHTPDLIITDWHMPGVNGIDFCRKLRASPRLQHVPIMMCTGVNTSSENLQLAFKVGVSDFIRKPLDHRELMARVRSLLMLSKFYKTIQQQNRQIKQEKEKSDKLLLSILPKKIADELKETGSSRPVFYDNVTVYIADIVGFTKKSTEIPLEKLISELNDIFTNFDRIMEEHGCERLKTVGDAYLAVCGMPEPDRDHGYRLVKAAMATMAYLRRRNAASEIRWEIRGGVHTGRVAGAIVGTNKYIYDVFGDSINTTARLEKSAEPMQLMLSQDTYELVKGRFDIREGQSILVKGKGQMTVFTIGP